MDDEYVSGWEGMWMGRSLVVLKNSFYSFCEQKKWAYQEKTKLGPQNVGAEFWIWNLCSLSGLQTWLLPCPPLTQSLCLTGQLFPSEICKHSQGSFLAEHKGNTQIQTYFKATVQGREVGGGIRMGNTCKSMADSCQCMGPEPGHILGFSNTRSRFLPSLHP